MHNFIVCMAQTKGNRNGRVGQFHSYIMFNPWTSGIVLMAVGRQVGAFGYFASFNVDDETSLSSYVDR